MKKLYVFGNEHLEFDAMAKTVAEKLKGVEVVHCRSPDDLLDVEGEIVILDVVKDILKPIVITDIEQIKTRNMLSLHDFDLGFFLNLLEEMGEGKKIKIIGIPDQGDVEEIARKVELCV